MNTLSEKTSNIILLNQAIIAINQFKLSLSPRKNKNKNFKPVAVDLESWFEKLMKRELLNKDMDFSKFQSLCGISGKSDFIVNLKKKIDENRIELMKHIKENYHSEMVASEEMLQDKPTVLALKEMIKKSSFIDILELVKKNITILPEDKYEADIKNTFTYAKNQLALEELLKFFQIPFTSMFEMTPVTQELRNRIFYTTSDDTIQGLQTLKFWYEKGNLDEKYKDLTPAAAAKLCSPFGVCNELESIKDDSENSKINKNKIEIAWGHLTSMGAHLETEAPPFFVVNLPSLECALEKCNKDSTLVIDGHGATDHISLGEFNKTSLTKAVSYIDKINSMKGMSNISHVMLNACTAGMLNTDASKRAFNKSDFYKEKLTKDNNKVMKSDFKNRNKLYVNPENENVLGNFEINNSIGHGLAARLAHLLLTKNQESEKRSEGMAFTFSPSLLNPDIEFGGNKAAIRRKEFDSSNWHQSDEPWENDVLLAGKKDEEYSDMFRKIAFKSVTLVNSLNNRKAPELNETNELVTWKRSCKK